ncbi:MAG: bifunctional adenosylcobinamide kinase/adenosylcobinamide-phosphate guanylyltransferase [Oscillospiraceae bacterium]|nr:bifunctional adenosylcobinamide kinase/adenosylcobinamide-phosphate guanylyltransferase [Oscillospiraceae bacterium]
MIFITGPLYAGKEEYIRKALGWGAEDFASNAVRDVQKLVPCDDLELLADELAVRKVVIATEVGCGIVPIDPAEQRWREEAGRLSCLLAERADTVIRVCCGIPQLLKGEWP